MRAVAIVLSVLCTPALAQFKCTDGEGIDLEQLKELRSELVKAKAAK